MYSHYFTERNLCVKLYTLRAGFAHTTTPNTFTSTSETSFYLWGPSGSGVIKTSVSRPSNRIKTRWTQVRKKIIYKFKSPLVFVRCWQFCNSCVVINFTEMFGIPSSIDLNYMGQLYSMFFLLLLYTK